MSGRDARGPLDMSGTTLASALQQLQQVDLGLDGAPADRGELHRLDRAREMPESLVVADDAPAHRAEHLPPMGARRIDFTAARPLVGRPQFLAAAEAAGRLVDGAEPPALHAQPAEILDRIAEMGAFPVEDRGHAG